MMEQIGQIAERIRELREIAGLTEDAIAQEFGITAETYRAYESGSADIPVSFLCEIAHKFRCELSEILTGETPRLHSYCLVRKDRGVSVERRKQYNYQNLAYNFIHKKAEPFLVTVEPKDEDVPVSFNSHPGQEFNYVLDGSLLIIINNKEMILNVGDSLYFDSTQPHGMKALGGKPARFLAIIF